MRNACRVCLKEEGDKMYGAETSTSFLKCKNPCQWRWRNECHWEAEKKYHPDSIVALCLASTYVPTSYSHTPQRKLSPTPYYIYFCYYSRPSTVCLFSPNPHPIPRTRTTNRLSEGAPFLQSSCSGSLVQFLQQAKEAHTLLNIFHWLVVRW